MAIREYIGARYVPRFMGTYDVTQIYDALDVVDNGFGTSYISRKTVPAGTPLTDTEYWAIYGATSGAIIQLQNDVAALQNLLSGRKFILLGDSFGYGITPPSYDSTNGVGWIKQFEQTVGQYCDVYYANVSVLPGVAGFASSLTFLTMLQSLESTITDPDSITDIVVMGGTNDVSQNGVTSAAIISAIETFMDYCRARYPYAHVKIGILSSRITEMYQNSAKPIDSYRECTKYGAEFMSDGISLYTIPSTRCSADDIHLTQAGYAYYTPYVNNLIISGHTSFLHEFNINLVKDAAKVDPFSNLVLNVTVTPHFFRLILRDTAYSGSMFVILDRTYNPGQRQTVADVFTLDANIYLPESVNVIGGGDLGIKDNNTGLISMCSTWRLYNTTPNKLTVQANVPVTNPHSGDSDYATICFVSSANHCMVPIE